MKSSCGKLLLEQYGQRHEDVPFLRVHHVLTDSIVYDTC
jgi:hypothetical protein